MPGMWRDEIRFRPISGRLITSRKSIAMRSTFFISVLQNVQIHAKLIKSSLLHEVTFAAFDYLCVMFVITSCRTSLIK